MQNFGQKTKEIDHMEDVDFKGFRCEVWTELNSFWTGFNGATL
jgi:hypothetical protein